MPDADGVAALPTLVALDARAVIEQERRGASIQVDESYFRGQEMAMDAIESESTLSRRRNVASYSRQLYDQMQVDFDSFTQETLRSVSAQFRQALQQMPEVDYLKGNFPGTCFVVPEWARTGGEVRYGARIYFFREDTAPAPTDILQRNIEAVVNDNRAEFEQYQGALHGYPECCIEYFFEHAREGTGPELDAVETIAEYVNDDLISESADSSVSIGDIMDGVFETEQVYAFFAREFFPEPGCARARRRGLSVYETLCDVYGENLVKDYFRINAGWSYLMAKATASEKKSAKRPSPGSLGREHLLFYLPLSVTVTAPRYASE